jgi:hypothetical protein
MKNPNFKLEHFEYEYFHDFTRQKAYLELKSLDIITNPDIFFQRNCAGESLFSLFFKEAPAKALTFFLPQIIETLSMSPTNVNQVNNRGQTFLHLLFENKHITLSEKYIILIQLKKQVDISSCLKIADFNNMIPLVAFIETQAKILQLVLKEHLDFISLLIPNIDKDTLSQGYHEDDVNFWALYGYSFIEERKVPNDFLEFLRNKFIYNDQIIKVCLHFKLEKLLVYLLKVMPHLNMNTFYSEHPRIRKHMLAFMLEKDCSWIVDVFFERYSTDLVRPLNSNPKIIEKVVPQDSMIRTFWEKFSQYPNITVLADILIEHKGLNNSITSKLFSQLKTSLSSLTNEERNLALMGCSYNKNIKTSYNNPPLITKLFVLKNKDIVDIIENTVIEVPTIDEVKQAILIGALEFRLTEFFTNEKLKPLMQFKM